MNKKWHPGLALLLLGIFSTAINRQTVIIDGVPRDTAIPFSALLKGAETVPFY